MQPEQDQNVEKSFSVSWYQDWLSQLIYSNKWETKFQWTRSFLVHWTLIGWMGLKPLGQTVQFGDGLGRAGHLGCPDGYNLIIMSFIVTSWTLMTSCRRLAQQRLVIEYINTECVLTAQRGLFCIILAIKGNIFQTITMLFWISLMDKWSFCDEIEFLHVWTCQF